MLACLLFALQDVEQEAFAARVLAELQDPAGLAQAIDAEPWRAERLTRDLLRQSIADPSSPWPLDTARTIAAALDEHEERPAARRDVERREGWSAEELERFLEQEQAWIDALGSAASGQLSEAEAHARAALDLASGLDAPWLLARVERTLGRIAFDAGQHARALEWFLLAQANLPEDPPENAQDALYAGYSARAIGEYELALAQFAAADSSESWEQRAMVAGSLGRYRTALEDLARAERRADSPNRRARLVLLRAAVNTEIGRTAEAMRLLDHLEEHWPGGGLDHLEQEFEAERERTRALVLHDQGNHAAALAHLERAETLTTTPSSLQRLRVTVLLAAGRAEEAKEFLELLPDEGPAYLRALRHLALGRAHRALGLPSELDDERALALAEELDAPELRWRALDGLARAGRATNEAAIRDIERIASHLDLPSLRLHHLDEELEVYRRLTQAEDVEQAYGWVRRMKGHASSLFAERSPEAERRTARNVHRVRRQKEGRSADWVPSGGLTPSASLREIQARLESGEALVDFVLGEEVSSAFVVTHSTLQRVELTISRDDVIALRDRLAAPITSLRAGATDAGNLAFDSKAAHALYQGLVAPLNLRSIERVHLVPDGPLWSIPFAALVVERGRRSVDPSLAYAHHRAHRFWIEDVAIGYLPSASWLRTATPNQRSSLGFGNPHPLPANVPTLTGALNETLLVPGTLRLGEHATETAFKELAPQHSPLHLCVHARVDPHWPEASHLLLAPSDQDDGFLRAREVAALQLGGAHVILSACDGHQETTGLAGVLGLPRAFLQAGAHSVIANRWPADDHATSQLFLRYLNSPTDPAMALREAQVWCIREGSANGIAYAHPFFWAGWSVFGN